MSRKYLYRVEWVDADGYPNVRHYQTRKAAEHRRNVLNDGRPEEPPVSFFDDGRPAVPPALTVTITRSDPITWDVDLQKVNSGGRKRQTAEADAPGMSPTVDTGDMGVCAGCGSTAPRNTEGWRYTDAAWCPKCAWLA